MLDLIAHDINNFCHAALSYLDLSLDGSQPPEDRAKYARQSRDLIERAARFAPNLKTLLELRSADLASMAPVGLGEALEQARKAVLQRHAGTALTLQTSGASWQGKVPGGRFVPEAFGQILENSVRFARPGKPPQVHADASQDGADWVRVTFRDEGRGFSGSQASYAAMRFAQSESISGSGLGLAIARLLAARTGGNIEVGNLQAERGVAGASIVLRLPLAPP